NGKSLASAGLDETVQLWNAATGTTLLNYFGHFGVVATVEWSPDSKRIASAGLDKTIQVWNALNGKIFWVYCCNSWVNGLAWNPDSQYIASANTDKTVQVRDEISDNLVLTFNGYKSKV